MSLLKMGPHWTSPPGLWDVFFFLAGFGPPETAWTVWMMVFYDRVALLIQTRLPE